MSNVVRLPRQVRRGVVVFARQGNFPNGSPYAFVWYEFQLGRGPVGKIRACLNPASAMADAKRIAKERGLPFVDRTQAVPVNYSSPHGAA